MTRPYPQTTPGPEVKGPDKAAVRRFWNMMISSFLVDPLACLLFAFWIMLALGVLHHDVSESVPALGYEGTWLLLMGLTVLRNMFIGVPWRKAKA